MTQARQWLLAQHVVIGHANHPTVTHLYGQIVELLQDRSLQTATLDDVFYGPAGRDRAVTASPGASPTAGSSRIPTGNPTQGPDSSPSRHQSQRPSRSPTSSPTQHRSDPG